MVFFDQLNKLDTRWLLRVNGSHSDFFDTFFAFFTSKETWIPLYLVLLVVIFIKYRRTGIWVALAFILTIVLSDQVSGLIKDLVQRLRPSHTIALKGLLNLPVGEGGLYGFVSSHAANSFALAVVAASISKSRRIWAIMIIWAILNAYSRIYVGVHYPFDVICGAILGLLIGWGMYRLILIFDNRFLRKKMAYAGLWKDKHKTPLLITFVIITVTLLITAMLVGKYNF
jgi:undecaprenyl-diphosphatase